MLAGVLTPIVVFVFVFGLNYVVPGQSVDGYVEDESTGRPLRYRLNGLRVLLIVLALYGLLGSLGWLPWDWFYLVRWPALVSACVIGLLYTLVLVLPAKPVTDSVVRDLFLGRTKNLQYVGRIDAKMYLYLVGAVLLALNIIGFAAHHVERFGTASNPGVFVYTGLFLFFLLDYLWFERVHLYTYDLFAERVGFKLAWGCLVFYPFFYGIGLWSTAELATPSLIERFGGWWLLLASLIFFAGWAIARGANLQKYVFKRFPERTFLGMPPTTLSAGNQSLLCSGYWGVARHINYLGEILMALGLTLALGQLDSPWPWLYPLYYVLLLFPRERDDERRCAEKYGELWQTYKGQVRYRIIPYIY